MKLEIEIPEEFVVELKKIGVSELEIPKVYFDFIEYESSYGIRDITKNPTFYCGVLLISARSCVMTC